jgi:hypothetical protein
MQGFKQAMQEYESKLFNPYDYEENNAEWEEEDPEVDRRLEDKE